MYRFFLQFNYGSDVSVKTKGPSSLQEDVAINIFLTRKFGLTGIFVTCSFVDITAVHMIPNVPMNKVVQNYQKKKTYAARVL